MKNKIFKYKFAQEEHIRGDENCPGCWSTYRCEYCGGIVHQEYYEEDWDNIYTHDFCEGCDEIEEQ